METRVPRCKVCEAEIEVEEPLVVIERDGERESSLAREPGLRERKEVMLLHVRCVPGASRAEDVRAVWDVPPLIVLESEDPDRVLRITLEGELDRTVCDQISLRLEQLRLDGTPVRLDLSGVDFVDSSGIRMLVVAVRRAGSDRGGRLEIVPEVTPNIRKVIELAGIGPVLLPGTDRLG
jgi:anti-sigma B factor antagonist